MRKMHVPVILTALMITLGAVISNPATLQAQEQTTKISQHVGANANTNAPTSPDRTTLVHDTKTRIVYQLKDESPTPKSHRAIHVDERQVHCLAKNIYFEARGEGHMGMVSIAYVSKNRVGVGKWPTTICGVIYDTQSGCQFSWTCDDHPDHVRSSRSYEQALGIARDVIMGIIPDPTGGALFYHNRSVTIRQIGNPNRFVLTTRIGNHTFYKLRN